MNIGADASPGQFNKGMLDDLRIYSLVLTQAQIQSDMAAPVGGTTAGSPQVSIDPINGPQVSGIVNVTATATDDTGVASVQFYVDGFPPPGSLDTTAPYALAWDTRTASNGAHTLTALATDVDGHTTLSAPVTVNVANSSYFQNEILATGFNLPTDIEVPSQWPHAGCGTSRCDHGCCVRPISPIRHHSCSSRMSAMAACSKDFYDVALDPNFATNHYIYIFYTLDTPNRDRLSRFTANADLTARGSGS